MIGKAALYSAIERVMGRELAWRVGRFLYLGARRELVGDPACNGEYQLICWTLDALTGAGLTPATRLHLLDVGANVGEWTARALEVVRSRSLIAQAVVHAFEPAPAQHEAYRRRFNQDLTTGTVVLSTSAVGREPSVAKFVVMGPVTGTSSLSAGAVAPGLEIDVGVTTLDEVVSRLDGHLALIKIDTEGNDFNVICGGRRAFELGRPMVVQFEYNWRWVGFGHCLRNVFAWLDGSDYVFGRLTQSHIELHDTWHPELEHYYETNCVLVRRDVVPWLPHRRVEFSQAGTLRPATSTGHRP